MSGTAPQRERRFHRRRAGLGVRSTLVLLLAVAAALAAALLAGMWIPVRNARDAYRDGSVSRAIEIAERWSGHLVWERQFDEILAACFLTAGREQAAAPHLAALRNATLWVPALPKTLVARKLFARGRYAGFLTYDDAVHEHRREADADVYRAAAQIATGRLPAATVTIGAVDRKVASAERLRAAEQALAERKSGSVPLVLDRAGRTIAAYQLANRDLVAVDAQFAPLVEKEAGALTIESQLPRIGTNDVIVTTLDPAVERAALAALGGFRGSLVAIDPRTNEILAIASNRGSGPLANLALEGQYEPGSVVKVLTALDALAGGVDVKSMFPYDCKGDLMIDGRHFGDWLPQGHGVLPSLDEAFAESCNIVFGEVGLRLGVDRIERFMRVAGFDGQTNPGLFPVPLGRIVPPILNRYETAFLAIGLKHETVSAFHLAMLASMMANRGTLTAPRLVVERRSILGDATPAPKPPSKQIVPREVAEQVVAAMAAVVTSPNGTGRRAAVEGTTVAMKTGTAGDASQSHLQSVILAFAPIDHPTIAFGMIAEDAGPAEFAGAKIAHDFVDAVKMRK